MPFRKAGLPGENCARFGVGTQTCANLLPKQIRDNRNQFVSIDLRNALPHPPTLTPHPQTTPETPLDGKVLARLGRGPGLPSRYIRITRAGRISAGRAEGGFSALH
jgi:FtsP/CotA-like multicopper oxidase with cupredoxin domain